MEFLQEITLELNSNTAYTTVGAKQGDHQSRNIKIHFTENGKDWAVPPKGSVEISYRVRKPDGYAVWNPATIPDPNPENVVYITLTEQVLAIPGRAYADILFISGAGENKQILSTVSFIIMIMASPNIATNILSSDEFSKVIDITDNANIILHEAEAWAIGTKSSVPVIANAFSYRIEGGTFTCTIDEAKFRSAVGISQGYTRNFILTCQGIPEGSIVNQWDLTYGDTVIPDVDLYDYGIIITSGSPLQSNTIQITITDAENQFHNNALYWSESAHSAQKSIENLQIDATTIHPDATPYVESELLDDVTLKSKPEQLEVNINKVTFAEKIGYIAQDHIFIYNGTNWTLNSLNVNLPYYGIGVTGTPVENDKIIINYNYHKEFMFYIPKGETGDVNFLTFDIHLDDGGLWMTRPDTMSPDIGFGIDETTGKLYFEINN